MSMNNAADSKQHNTPRVFSAERRLGVRPTAVAHELKAPAPVAVAAAAGIIFDNSEVLAAIARLEEKLTRSVELVPEVENLQVEISEIAGRIKATKVEMAALRHPLESENKFKSAAEDLSAIVGATERATTQIIDSVEKIDEIAHELQTTTDDAYIKGRLAAVNEAIMDVYQACNFQDLTGQKIRKVVNTLAFIEERIESMVAMWNAAELAALPMAPDLHRTDGDVVLHGPDLAPVSSVSSQADIDALFD
jgi:chemotaxis protein CheZ